MTHDRTPDLSIIVPVLNETAQLPFLFATLAAQQGIRIELILCDGVSEDTTPQRAAQLARQTPFSTKFVQASRGRGRQMNAGAAIARADTLLFLHVDSTFAADDALGGALAALRVWQAATGCDEVAGRFALRFRRSDGKPSLAYFFYEAKARLARKECIRGDQGFMLSRSFFRSLNGFDEQMPFLEDLHFVDAVAARGEWLLLPAEVGTSARRFETEGLWERQVLNAIIVNCLVAGWTEFFATLSGLYRFNSETGRLSLYPILYGIRALLARRPWRWRLAFWHATGRHVAANAWQIFFWQDTRRTFSSGMGPGEVEPRWLRLYERRMKRLFCAFPAAMTAAAAVWLWFRFMLLRHAPTGTRRTG
ncbi:MAG: TIGR04283 family arsenosugar biosynthesis glycosyltransferase [Oryzomonas sp.]|uniref:TIGR04283 family arsenosugar biosynthesis glycosyltransferase n=1 Tax=Oryzomonas sp. TaxID=2855186 RepID=UPI00283F6FCE|nr:TIGR04283 family arsenosugar biosynthesis glycosyltransferase [Oryzomonas sp.]MDR3579153.1 TIGR04283 family arsenosugar biosynthesis glycosyltransferase [Oryzomonas sp.]